jgi:hypothetical protein
MTLAASVVASNFGAQAQTYIGPGSVACAKFSSLAADNNPDAIYIDYWLRGYVSGINAAWKGVKGTDPLLNVEPMRVSLFVLKYCDANPSKNVLNAVNEFFWSLPK